MLVQDFNIYDVVNYCNAYEEDISLLQMFLKASIRYVENYTGINCQPDDLKLAVLMLTNEMYENRSATVDNDKSNKILESILGFYDNNLL